MSDLVSIGELLEHRSFKTIEGAAVALRWEKVVESSISAQTEALKFERGVLFVEVSSSVWANELTFLKPDIINKLNQNLETPAVKDIRFLVKGISYAKAK